MDNISNINNFYFIGIGGIGMSAIAQYLLKKKHNIAGYDLVRNNNCVNLEKQGVQIHYNEDVELIPKEYHCKEKTIIVYTPAIPNNHKELKYFKNNGFKILKRSELLKIISKSVKSIAIAGTHGKTSVSSICSWIFKNSDKKASAFLGGISKNLNSNLMINENSEYMIIEADEFDKSFLNLNPYYTLVTCIEEDHLDIYENISNINKSFKEFIDLTNDKGYVILNNSINKDNLGELNTKAKIYLYGQNGKSDFFAKNIKQLKTKCSFDFLYPNGIIENIEVKNGGDFIVENTVAACAISILAGISKEDIKNAVKSYLGVKRRFDVKYESNDLTVIDDYAHHPSEIDAVIKAVKKVYPGKSICGIFQPHLYSRTKDFYMEFANSLSKLDQLILLPIYPARENPMKGVNSNLIFDNCKIQNKVLIEKENLIQLIKSKVMNNIDIILFMGAGDIDAEVEKINSILAKK